MNIEILREYCISKKDFTESFPFDDETLVFKVAGKIFALANLEEDLEINLKYDPSLALELRERYASVTPGYHMNRIIVPFKYTVKQDKLKQAYVTLNSRLVFELTLLFNLNYVILK